MIDKPRVLLDVDGVIADFVSSFLLVANEVCGTSYTHSDFVNWDMMSLPGLAEHEEDIFDLIKEPGWARTLNPYPGAQDGVKRLREVSDVYVVTSPIIGSTFFYDRLRWLDDYFDFPSKKVVFTYSKHVVDGDLLIDDKPKNITSWLREGHAPWRSGFIWDRAWNTELQSDNLTIFRTNSWDTIIRMVQLGLS